MTSAEPGPTKKINKAGLLAKTAYTSMENQQTTPTPAPKTYSNYPHTHQKDCKALPISSP